MFTHAAARIFVGALVLCAARPALAQLDENCMVSVLNRTVRANPDGSWVLPNVPANFGMVRARATCTVDGVTISGESDPFDIPANRIIDRQTIIFGQSTPIPASLVISSSTPTLTQAGATAALEVNARYPDGTAATVTAASTGTQYTISNQAIATVSPDGMVQAVGSGTAIVQATHEGASGLFLIRVALSGTDRDGDGLPDDYELANGLDSNDALDAQEDPDRDDLTTLQEFQLGTNPRNRDSDGDGLTDGAEVNVHRTNALLADTDGDRIPDGVEVQTGSDPLSSSSYNLTAATASSIVQPLSFVLTTSALFPTASVALSWRVTLIDGRTTLDLTADARTSYSSSNLTICNFSAEKGRVFAGSPGACVITLTHDMLSASAFGTVRSFTPTALASLSVPGFANNVDVAGDYAYVAAGAAGLQVVDVSNRAAPSIVASATLPGNANDVFVSGGFAYVAAGSAGLQIVNVQSPSAPTVAGSLDTGGIAWDVVVRGSRAYVANGANGLVVVDVSSPASPARLGAVALSGTTKGVDVDPARLIAVAARGTAGLSVIDVANPSAPTVRATLAGGDARDVAISGNHAFIADMSRSFTSVDITNPAAPVLRGSTSLAGGGRLEDVAVAGTVAAGADVFMVNGVPLIDVSAPASPQARVVLDFNSRFGQADGTGIAIDANFVYLTAGPFVENGVTGSTRLYIGQYRMIEDTAAIPPTIRISSPTDGSEAVHGATVTVTADATDDIGVAAVTFFLDGQFAFTATSAPFQYTFRAPATGSSFTLGATAIDWGKNVGTAANVTVQLVPDPLTTVTGRVLDRNGAPVFDAAVTAFSRSATTLADGTFSIAGVPTILGPVVVTATATVGGESLTRQSASVAVVAGATTHVGDIVFGRPLQVMVPSPTSGFVVNSANCMPFLCNYPTRRFQQVYSAALFSGITQINSLTFFQEYAAFWGPGTTVLPGSYRISLSTTARAVGGLDYILESNVGPDSTVIFNGNLGGLSVRPSFTITAPVPFTYDPRAGNLLLDIVVENQAMTAPSTWGANDAFFTHYNNGVTSRAFNLGVQATGVDNGGLVTEFNR